MPAVPGRSAARVATVAVAFGPAVLAEPHYPRGEYGGGPLSVWVVHVREPAPPPPGAAEPLEWLLPTDLPAGSAARAWERVGWYEHRPAVEAFHKGQKTGAGIENLQFESRASLEPVVALLGVVAAMLLDLRRARPARPAPTGGPRRRWGSPARTSGSCRPGGSARPGTT